MSGVKDRSSCVGSTGGRSGGHTGFRHRSSRSGCCRSGGEGSRVSRVDGAAVGGRLEGIVAINIDTTRGQWRSDYADLDVSIVSCK